MIEYHKNFSLEPLFYINEEGLVCQEEWKDVVGFEGLYRVSNLGRIKSLERIVNRINSPYKIETKILKPRESKRRYLVCDIGYKKRTIHQLVAMAFLNHIPCKYKLVVDHKNNNPLDNRLENLQLTTQRNNASKDKKNKSSKYTGVSWNKKRNIWISSIRFLGTKIVLYSGIDEELASSFYLKAKENSLLFKGNVIEFKKKLKTLIL
jgi:hypothetical protein